MTTLSAITPKSFDATSFPRFHDLRREREAIIDGAVLVAPRKEPT